MHGYGPAAARISIRARRQGTERHTKVRGAVSMAFGASQEQHGRWEEMLERAARERERERARDAVTPYRCLRLDAAGGSRAAERSRARRPVHRWYLRGRRRLRAPRGSRQVTPSRRPDPPQRPSGASGEQAEAAGADPQSSPRRRPCSPRLVSQLPRRLDGRCCCIALVCCCLQRGSPPSRPTAPRR